MFLFYKFIGLLVPLVMVIALLTYGACRNRVCLAITKFLITALFVCMFVSSVVMVLCMLLSIFTPGLPWVSLSAGILWLFVGLTVVISLSGSPVLLVFILNESIDSFKAWKLLKERHRVCDKSKLDWHDGSYFDVSSQSLVVTRIDLRAAKTDSGVRLAPAMRIPTSICSDPIASVVFCPLWFFIVARQVLFFTMYSPIEIPWSAMKSLEQKDDGFYIEISDTKHPLKISTEFSNSVKQNLLSDRSSAAE